MRPMTDDDFRALALGLPETSEGVHDGCATFAVRGRRFATLGWPGAGKVSLALGPEQLELLLEASPGAIERAPGAWGQRGHCRLDLAAADAATIRSVIVMAWRRSAPARLARSFGG
jgi:hypothetical protein